MLVPPPIRTLAARVRDAGGRAYVVGGCVRDDRMRLPVKDWDVEVFGLDVEPLVAILRRLGSVNTVGRSFGVFKWRPHGTDGEIDVSVPRRDSKVGPGHKGIAVVGDPTMTTTEAARRRDLTVNAMMVDVLDDTLVDPWNGLQDLERGVLRAVDRDTFLEDPLRALRVVQFAARLGFTADPSLVELCRTAALDELPAERVQGEWHKLLLKGVEPSRGFRVAREARILERVFPEAADLDADDVLDLLADRRAAFEPEGRRFALMLAGWLHAASEAAIVATLDRLWLHTWAGYPIRDRVLATVASRSAPVATDTDLRRLSTKAELPLVLTLREAVTGEDLSDATARAGALGLLQGPPEALLKGRDLKGLVEPGPRMGEVLRAVYELQLEGRVTSPEEALAAAKAWLA